MPSNTSSDTDGTGSDNTGGGTGSGTGTGTGSGTGTGGDNTGGGTGTGSGSGGDNTGGSTGTGSGSGSGSGGTGSDIPNIDTYQPKNTYSYGGSKSFRIQTGTGTDSATNAMSFDTGVDLSILEVDLSSIEACLESIHNIRAAIDFVAQKTADIGIAQRRLETVSNVNTVKIENLSATHTAVAGADTAQEVANYTKAQIMAQTAASLITQTRAFQANLLMRMIGALG